MKQTSFFLAIAVIVHLLIIDLTYYTITADILNNSIPILGYNFVWIAVAISIANQTVEESRDN